MLIQNINLRLLEIPHFALNVYDRIKFRYSWWWEKINFKEMTYEEL